MGFLGALFGISKLNADADQQEFARRLIAAAEEGRHVELVNWVITRPWRASETRNRIAHALSIVRVSSVPATYQIAKEIGLELTHSSYRLG
jgi:hypothetical protein